MLAGRDERARSYPLLGLARRAETRDNGPGHPYLSHVPKGAP